MMTWTIRICALGFVAICLFSSWQGAVENHQFNVRGEKAPIEPILQYTETRKTEKQYGIKTGESTERHATVTFTTRSGQRIQLTERLPDDVFAQLQKGEPAYIEYLPESPGTARFVGHTAYPFTAALFGIVVALLTGFFWKKM